MNGRAAAALTLLALVGARYVDAARLCVAHMASCRAERCPDTTGTERRRCRDVCRAVTGCAAGGPRIRTLAAVVNECRAANGMWTSSQRLDIRRGDRPPVSVTAIEGSESAIDLGVCALYGQGRVGASAMSVGALQGLAVSPDGSTVVFQVTDDFAGRLVINGVHIPTPPYTLATEGIFVVHADGSGPHRIADQVREPPFAIRSSPGSVGDIAIFTSNGLEFSPDGRALVLTDRGPGIDGSDAPQLFTLDPATGARCQLTSFTASSVGTNPSGLNVGGVFLDNRRIGGYVRDSVEGDRLFTMARDCKDKELHFIPLPSSIPGATIVPDFRVTGAISDVFSLTFPDRITNQPFPGPVMEVFVRDGENTLQLTKFGRSDTAWAIRLRDQQHILFRASADPVGLNPRNGSQLFRIDRLAGHLRQLTRFEPSATPLVACTGAPTPTCTTPVDAGIQQDRVTGSLVFDSTCDPFGLNAVSQQLYALRPDGSGLRQLSDYGGLTCNGATVHVELPGPISYSAPFL